LPVTLTGPQAPSLSYFSLPFLFLVLILHNVEQKHVPLFEHFHVCSVNVLRKKRKVICGRGYGMSRVKLLLKAVEDKFPKRMKMGRLWPVSHPALVMVGSCLSRKLSDMDMHAPLCVQIYSGTLCVVD
jgi:hypothetical protein